jgi:hypothetical protein
VYRIDLVLAGEPFGKPLAEALPTLAGDHAGVVSGQPAPLLADGARECLNLRLMRSQFICVSKRRGDARPASAPDRPVFATAKNHFNVQHH